jgi:AcrR family transcriptional regulator
MSLRPTSEFRRRKVTESAVSVFALGGYHGATIADVALDAGISPSYVFKLFPGKESLFVAAVAECFDGVLAALSAGADQAPAGTPDAVLDAMSSAYARLIVDRTLLMLQVHAQSVADIPEIGRALRDGIAKTTRFVKSRSGASDVDVQRFFAYGQLCHLIVTTGIDAVPEDWALLLSRDIQHPL